jgi:Fur family ferric uptake transcriptional regulator
LGIPEIPQEVEKNGMNYVSVYRTVQAFADAGIIRSVNLRHGHVDYELVRDDDHHHLVCTGCGKIEEFEDCGMDALIVSVLKRAPSFKRITDHALEFFGTCKACAR